MRVGWTLPFLNLSTFTINSSSESSGGRNFLRWFASKARPPDRTLAIKQQNFPISRLLSCVSKPVITASEVLNVVFLDLI